MNLTDQLNTFLCVGAYVTTEHGKCIEPHCQVMKILTIPVRLFTNTNAARPTEHPVDLGNKAFSFIEERRIIQSFV
jgi:hypothetical protein